MLVLLLIPDNSRRHRLAEACRSISPDLHCMDSSDAIGAMFAVAPHRLDLVVLDPALITRHGGGWLASWRRLLPMGSLLTLKSTHEEDIALVDNAIRGLRTRLAPDLG